MSSESVKQAGPLRLATIFSGIGAPEHALQRLGWDYQSVFACDNDKFARKSYEANYELGPFFDDVCDISGAEFADKVDLLIGGPPCQAFSSFGLQRGIGEQRGQLLWEFFRVVSEVRPRVFIFENVTGLLRRKHRKSFDVMLDEFRALGYRVYGRTLNARNYGVPQSRERVFAVCFRDTEREFTFPRPMDLTVTLQDLLEDAPHVKYHLNDKQMNAVGQRILDDFVTINSKIAMCQTTQQGNSRNGDLIAVDAKYSLSNLAMRSIQRRIRNGLASVDDAIAQCLLSRYDSNWNGSFVSLPSGRLRNLTPRECLRLMGFADTWQIVVSDRQMYKQAGNSMVVDVLMALMKAIYERSETRPDAPHASEQREASILTSSH